MIIPHQRQEGNWIIQDNYYETTLFILQFPTSLTDHLTATTIKKKGPTRSLYYINSVSLLLILCPLIKSLSYVTTSSKYLCRARHEGLCKQVIHTITNLQNTGYTCAIFPYFHPSQTAFLSKRIIFAQISDPQMFTH